MHLSYSVAVSECSCSMLFEIDRVRMQNDSVSGTIGINTSLSHSQENMIH